MKFPRLLVLVGIAGLIIFLKLFLPTEKEREESVMNELVNRNTLEKQLVGKWSSIRYVDGLVLYGRFHLLSANLKYRYRGTDNSKIWGITWCVNQSDSVLTTKTASGDQNRYKLLEITPNRIKLQYIKNDSLAQIEHWYRHPYGDYN
ncbi:hypothetical protein PK35_15345 [Tamlana nanhaiensis]|uniref:Lipocalin-like domain-containing protein n=1 Tax=Neotamlana nanhaiensis TaxID=1382798 RepID=A0A0D7W030_9FLAO|nr:hypothetical protein [Tamlana nanhaiensis]KJD31212.1 hypothetical protein PK35_15345 [Tamlana nanhaiensis]